MKGAAGWRLLWLGRCLGLCWVLGVVVSPAAQAQRGHAFGFAFAEAGAGAGELSGPVDVAVNEVTGVVYVADRGNHRVEFFSASGSFLGEVDGAGTPAGSVGSPEEIAVDNTCRLRELESGSALSASACHALDPSNEDVYVTDGSAPLVVDKFGPGGQYLGQITSVPAHENAAHESVPENRFRGVFGGVAVDGSGNVWIDIGREGRQFEPFVYEFDDEAVNAFEGTEVDMRLPRFSPFLAAGLAVDRAGDIFAHVTHLDPGTDIVSEYSVAGGIVDEAFDEVPSSGVAVEELTGDVYFDDVGAVDRVGPDGGRLESLGVPGAQGAGVAVNETTGVVYAADSGEGKVDVYPLEPPGPPTVENEFARGVSAEGVKLEAEVDPRGAAASYVFEYGRCVAVTECAQSGFESSLPVEGGMIAGDFELHRVHVGVGGLSPGSLYHFRVVAQNEPKAGGGVVSVAGREVVFQTQQVGGELVLPDGRGWELVSPPNKHGASLQAIGEQGVVQAAADGDAITYPANTPTEESPAGFSNSIQVISERGPSGWVSRDLTVPHSGPTGQSNGTGYEYRYFSEDLAMAIVQPFGAFVALSPSASEETAYRQTLDAPGGREACMDDCYQPLVSGCPVEEESCSPAVSEGADVPPGTVFGGLVGGKCTELGQTACGPKFRGATPDGQSVVLTSNKPLLHGAGAGDYEWSGGVLRFIGVPEAATGSFDAISSDGQRVVFDGLAVGESRLMVSTPAAEEAVQMDAPEAGCGTCVGGNGVFQASDGDVSRVFFTDEEDLTASSGGSTSNHAADLYACDVQVGEGKLGCSLTDLTPMSGGERAGVVGVAGVSEDGSWVYFVANGVLAPGAAHGSCAQSTFVTATASCNLYVLHRGIGGWEAPRLVAVVSGADLPDWVRSRQAHVARVSPDGEWLAFMSLRSLTGYDSTDVSSVGGSSHVDEEVFLYHAAGPGSLVCVSCNPTGTRPSGVEYRRLSDGLAGGDRVWPNAQWIAANLSGWTPYQLELSVYQSRALFDDGRVLFDSSDGLVPQDRNGAEDVYEYEPESVGSCSEASTTFDGLSGGCTGLISSGTSSDESGFVDASKSGSDVFFMTAAKLRANDVDAAVDVYDARECSAASPCVTGSVSESAPVAPCSSNESCRPSTAPQSGFTLPASALFSGLGNLTPTATGPTPAKKVPARRLTAAQRLAKALSTCHRMHNHKKRRKCELKARHAAKAKPSVRKAERGAR
jgi:hypothetical protein